MGLDIHGLNWLKYASKKGGLGKTATLARQGTHISKKYLESVGIITASEYCEDILIKYLGAEKVDSYDFSNYENATHICDLSLIQEFEQQYDTIIDYGVTEHVYHITNALMNISNLCQVGGQILHVLPTNNYCGHGFWQISPELFFSLYTENNGYEQTEVFVAEPSNIDVWYKVNKPSNGQRVNIWTEDELIVLVRTIKVKPHMHKSVYQSDYSYLWSNKQLMQIDNIKPKSIIRKIFGKILHIFNRVINLNQRNKTDLLRNQSLTKIMVKDLV